MSQTKFVDVLLAQDANGYTRTFVMPTSTAYVGDLILHEGKLFTIINSSWIDVNGDLYPILEGSTTLYTPDKVLNSRWEKEDQEAADVAAPGNP